MNFIFNILMVEQHFSYLSLTVYFDINLVCTVYTIWGRRMIGISGSLICSKTLMELILTPVVNIGEIRRALLAKSTPLTSSFVTLGSCHIF